MATIGNDYDWIFSVTFTTVPTSFDGSSIKMLFFGGATGGDKVGAILSCETTGLANNVCGGRDVPEPGTLGLLGLGLAGLGFGMRRRRKV